MEKENKNKKVILIILLLLVIGLTIGFAAFTSQLKIQLSATVSPDPSNFKVVFSSSATSATQGSLIYGGVAQGGIFEQNATTLSGLTANFTAPGQTAIWKFYSFNAGEYDAFLNKVSLGAIVCVPDGADPNKVAEAAKGISIKISVGGQTYTSSNEAIDSHGLAKGVGEEVVVTLEYAAGSAAVDGKFDVSIGDITLEYNSAD